MKILYIHVSKYVYIINYLLKTSIKLQNKNISTDIILHIAAASRDILIVKDKQGGGEFAYNE
jgi:hypothetical protein